MIKMKFKTKNNYWIHTLLILSLAKVWPPFQGVQPNLFSSDGHFIVQTMFEPSHEKTNNLSF